MELQHPSPARAIHQHPAGKLWDAGHDAPWDGGELILGGCSALPWFEMMEDDVAHVPSISPGSPHRVCPPGRRAPPDSPWLPHSIPKTPLHHLQMDTGDLPSPCVPLPRATHGGRTRHLPSRLSASQQPASPSAGGGSAAYLPTNPLQQKHIFLPAHLPELPSPGI